MSCSSPVGRRPQADEDAPGGEAAVNWQMAPVNRSSKKRSATDPGNKGYGSSKGVKRPKKTNLDEMMKAFDERVRTQPESASPLCGRASARKLAGDLQGALADYDNALSLEPKNATIMANRGMVQLELGWYRQAQKSFQGAFVIDPASPAAANGRAMVQKQEKMSPLRVVSLRGFKRASLNTSFVERRGSAYTVSGFETYWSTDGRYVLYYCVQESRWKGGRTSDFQSIRAGDGICFVGAPPRTNLLSQELIKAWYEWNGDAWRILPRAGVTGIGPTTPPLRTVTLVGFSRQAINTVYSERRQPGYRVCDRETFWSGDERYFLFWCKDESRWKGSVTSHLPLIREGRSTSFIGAPLGIDILASSFPKGWYEWQNKEWVLREGAGVATVGPTPLLLRTVTLSGFSRKGVNVRYEERRSPDYQVGHRETFFSADGKWFVYWSSGEMRWKVSQVNYLQKVQLGGSSGYLGGPVGADILSPVLTWGWHEWRKGAWNFKATAGVCAIGCSEEHDVEDDPEPEAFPGAEVGPTC